MGKTVKDTLDRAIEYLRQVPTGKAQVSVKEVGQLSAFRSRRMDLHIAVAQWAELHGFTFSSDRADPATATLYYFRVKS